MHQALADYLIDSWQRSILFVDVLRQRGNQYREHIAKQAPHVLRYAMEVFADCFAPPFREQLYPAVEEMQDILGRANDSHVASQRLAVLRDRLRVLRSTDWKRFKLGIEGLLRSHQQRLPRERRHFLKWWSRWQESGAEAVFVGLLKLPETLSTRDGQRSHAGR